MTDYYTENLSEFGRRELAEVKDLLTAMIDKGLPLDFDDEEVRPAFNKNSGFVFLTNSEYQVAMYDEETKSLFSFYSTPYGGEEGSLEELLEIFEDLHPDDQEFVNDLKELTS